MVGKKFHDYDNIKNFAIIYKPGDGPKKLYFQFKSSTKTILSIQLFNNDPIAIRDILLQYLKEDLKRNDQSTTEALSQFFKF
jgi:hypothetical protein